jgi:hypothetical protein
MLPNAVYQFAKRQQETWNALAIAGRGFRQGVTLASFRKSRFSGITQSQRSKDLAGRI